MQMLMMAAVAIKNERDESVTGDGRRWMMIYAGLARPWLLAFGFLAFSSFFE
jgi:hypothetical protein